MIRLRLLPLLGGVAAVGALALMVVRSQVKQADIHARIGPEMRQFVQLDAVATQQALASRFGLLSNYDPLVQTLGQQEALQKQIQQDLHALYPQKPAELEQRLDANIAALADKQELVEQFKSHNAVLKNSVAYLPVLVEGMISRLADSRVASAYGNLLRDLMIYNTTGDTQEEPRLAEQIERLKSQRGSQPQAVLEEYDLGLAHAQTLLREKKLTDSLIASIAVAPVEASTETLDRSYRIEYSHTLAQANANRTYLYVYCGALLVVVGLMLARIRRSQAELNRLNATLEERVAQRTEALAQANSEMDLVVADLERLMEAVQTNTNVIADHSASLSTAVQHVEQAAVGILNSIEDVTHATEHSSRTSQDMVAYSIRQGHTASEAVSIMERLGAAIRQVQESDEQQRATSMQVDEVTRQVATAAGDMAATANQMAAKTTQALATAETGGKAVQQAIQSMERIRAQVQTSATSVLDLGKKGAEIGSIVATIEHIADQTNLLALNAAIEAARAGVHGQGFAVVADEVRKLAERATAATREIAALVTTVQSGVATAVQAIQLSGEEVETGSKRGSEAVQALEQIITASQAAAQEVDRATLTTQELSQSIQNVVTFVQTINRTAQQNATVVAEMVRCADQVTTVITEAAQTHTTTQNSAEQVCATAEEIFSSTSTVAMTVKQQTRSIEQISGVARDLHAMSAELQALLSREEAEEEEAEEAVSEPRSYLKAA
jgi:methyl-accepting chemotaxis protein